MKVSPPRAGSTRVLALCLLASLPTPRASAAPTKAPSHKAPPGRVDFQASFSAAVRHYENLDYEQALEQLSRARALAQGIEQEAAVTLYQGLVQAELGQRVQSLDSFRTSLYLKPDAKLPVKVSPKVERDFEDVRQSVLRDLGISSPDPQASADRPMQTPGLTALVAPPSQTPAYVPSVGTEPASGRGPLLPVVFLGAGALAGGAAGFFGLQSQTNVRLAREATFYDERAARLKSAEGQAFVANILFGTAGAAALGALVTFFIPGSSHPPASASTEGTP